MPWKPTPEYEAERARCAPAPYVAENSAPPGIAGPVIILAIIASGCVALGLWAGYIPLPKPSMFLP